MPVAPLTCNLLSKVLCIILLSAKRCVKVVKQILPCRESHFVQNWGYLTARLVKYRFFRRGNHQYMYVYM